MKTTMSLGLVSIFALLQVMFLPLNFALLLILILVSRVNNQLILLLIITSSLFLSLFGGLGIGVSIMSFSSAILVFLIFKRYLPDRQIVNVSLLLFTLVFWEIMVRSSIAVLTILV